MRKGWSAIAVVVFALAAVGFAQTSAGSAVLRDAGVSGPPPTYTALSFASPRSLPIQLLSPEALLPADFVIRNEAPDVHRYAWQVLKVRNGRTQELASGQAAVGPGSATTVSRAFVISCTGGQVGVIVRLAGSRESIEFWSTCVSAARGSS